MRPVAPRAGRTRALWGWAVAGALAGVLATTLLLAPARWLAALLAHASDGMVTLVETDGSAWTGSGVLALTGGTGSRDHTRLPGRIHWQLRPALGGLHLRLRADCCTPGQPLTLALQPRWLGADVAVADNETQWPATVLMGLGTPWNTIRARGELTLATQQLRLALRPRRVDLHGQARLTARDMASNLSTVRPLGSYLLQLDGGETLTFELSTLDGSLLLSGTGSVVAGNLRFRGEASAADGMQAQLANLLNLLGVRRGDKAILSFG